MRAKEWVPVACVLAIALNIFLYGYTYGKAKADEYYAAHPAEVTYHQQQIITQPGDAICPIGHACQWRVWDLDSNSEVPLVSVK